MLLRKQFHLPGLHDMPVLVQVDRLVKELADELPQNTPDASISNVSGGPRWNTLPVPGKVGLHGHLTSLD